MSFFIPIKKTPKSLIEKIILSIAKNNGKFSGDENRGIIEISIPLGK